MPNPYHDETGRFCSKGEMQSAIVRLNDAGKSREAYTLAQEYNAIQHEASKSNFLKRMISKPAKITPPEPLTSVGSYDDIDQIGKGKNGSLGTLKHYFNNTGTLSEDARQYVSTFVVDIEKQKQEIVNLQREGQYVATDKAIYRAYITETRKLADNMKDNKVKATDSSVESYLAANEKHYEKLAADGSDVGKIHLAALKKMQKTYLDALDDEEYETYVERSEKILSKV